MPVSINRIATKVAHSPQIPITTKELIANLVLNERFTNSPKFVLSPNAFTGFKVQNRVTSGQTDIILKLFEKTTSCTEQIKDVAIKVQVKSRLQSRKKT